MEIKKQDKKDAKIQPLANLPLANLPLANLPLVTLTQKDMSSVSGGWPPDW